MEKTTPQNKKALGALGLLGLLILIAYLTKDKWLDYLPKLGKASGSSSPPSTSTGGSKKVTTSSGSSTNTPLDKHKTLKRGDKGAEVKALQELLNKILQYRFPNENRITVDGIFGSETETALKKVVNNGSISIDQLEKGWAKALNSSNQTTQGIPLLQWNQIWQMG